jgi:dipeptidyl aminopeptidase/acylaminoacyl peptidase
MNNNKGTKVAEVVEETPYQSPTATRLPTETTETNPSPTPTTEDVVIVVPSDTLEPIITDTPAPTVTDTLTPVPEKETIGGADKMAFISNNDIWLIDVNGENLTQISNDGTQKIDMQWMPDGKSLIYITGKCIKTVNVETLRVDLITCFEAENPPEAFEISPDGKMVAVSLNRMLIVAEYDVEKLQTVRFWNDLLPLTTCKTFAPYDDEIVSYMRWSEDGKKLALVLQVASGGKRVDVIRVINVADCYDIPERFGVQFPESFFGISGYNENPRIPNFHWTGDRNFVLTGYIRNNGFGDMYFFDLELNRAEERVNPIDGACCYRDPSFSPDGRYLAFAYQAISSENKIFLYYILTGSIGTGEKYKPFQLPDSFFNIRTESPQPILRPAP